MIKYILTSLRNYFDQLQKSEEQKYIENAFDAIDLEHRQRRVMNGTAPYQIRYDHTRNYPEERY